MTTADKPQDRSLSRGIGSSIEGPVGRLLARSGHFRAARPAPPRGVRKTAVGSYFVISWEPPERRTVFTHYRIRIDTDAGEPAFEVPENTHQVHSLTGSNFFVSTYLHEADAESVRVKAA